MRSIIRPSWCERRRLASHHAMISTEKRAGLLRRRAPMGLLMLRFFLSLAWRALSQRSKPTTMQHQRAHAEARAPSEEGRTGGHGGTKTRDRRPNFCFLSEQLMAIGLEAFWPYDYYETQSVTITRPRFPLLLITLLNNNSINYIASMPHSLDGFQSKSPLIPLLPYMLPIFSLDSCNHA